MDGDKIPLFQLRNNTPGQKKKLYLNGSKETFEQKRVTNTLHSRALCVSIRDRSVFNLKGGKY